MTFLVCKSPKQHAAAQRRKAAPACAYVLCVDIGAEPVFSVSTGDGPGMSAAGSALFAAHVAEAHRAVRRGLPFFRSVFHYPEG